jgi:N-acetyl-1-D-myo-inositol-2-amino-2-deoxy-alpha-D-glucopyranoside deacetylase
LDPKPVLLAVLAHPDDETFGMGGTLALYARRGAEVHLICATRGEVGEASPELLEGFASVGERREYELRCAAEML